MTEQKQIIQDCIDAIKWAQENTSPDRPELYSDFFNILTNAYVNAENLLATIQTPPPARVVTDEQINDAAWEIADQNEWEYESNRAIFLNAFTKGGKHVRSLLSQDNKEGGENA